MMTSYKDLCKIRIMNNPCPLCGGRPELKNTKIVLVGDDQEDQFKAKAGTKVRVCKSH